MLCRHLLALLDIVLNIAELLLKVVQSLERARDLLLLTLEFLHGPMLEPKQLGIAHSLVSVAHFLQFCLLIHELLLNALFAQGLLLKHHYGLREVLLAQVHLHCICKEGLHRCLVGIGSADRLHIRVSRDAIGIHILVCRLFGLIDHFLTLIASG